jgi:hypothetical protein
MADLPRRLCVVASDWLQSGEFIAALRALLRPQEPLAIIVDRRRGGSLMESGLEDRRRQPLVDLALATNGFAIVAASVDPKEGRTQVSLLLPEVPIEPLVPTDDEDLERLESIRNFQRRRSGRPFPRLGDAFLKGLQMVEHIVELRQALPILTKLLAVLIGVTLATFVLSPVGQNLGKSLIGRIFQGSPPASGGQAAARPAAQLPSVGQPPAQIHEASTLALSTPVHPARELLSSDGPASTKQAPLRDADRLIATPRETSPPPKETGTTSRETGTTSRATSTSPKESNAPPKAATAQDGSGRSSLSVAVRPSPSVPPESKPVASRPSRDAATSKATRPRFAGSPRVVLAREPVSRAWGKSYAVRLLNSAGQPMAAAEVWLVARRMDGTVEKIPMGALPELGTYRATVPTGRSAPIDLQVRVSTGDKRVEVPVKP